MVIVETVLALRTLVGGARSDNKKVALVATMGNLHEGHVALINVAKQHADFVVATIFVNPLQFGPTEDLEKYPRTPEADQSKLKDAGCDLLFLPDVAEMYPEGFEAQPMVSVPRVSDGLCGAARPGHFNGMATVVNKMFNVVQPDIAVFGEKDYQQLAVIRSMVRNLNIPIEILGAPTVRAADGLALSSRNGYLNEQERAAAPILYQCLKDVALSLQRGCLDVEQLLDEQCKRITSSGFQLEYLEIRNAYDLSLTSETSGHLVILVAARLGKTRLIDNVVVSVSEL
ncbi:pantoate--beta-alanine ligase [Pseudomonas sp. TH41]|uniref:pantoate--beta-alanine ligase n=1 Tax=Pseudomonas sp. TH41 TaxID=2796405 RepID=UPI0019123CF6|nr:pantoate--beta-alanine ligase [Pseudomonas sp. TH41]MBK5351274.1 pantoate--beta-alanine ligase [Pseudomonas sp. TH41]